MIRKIIKLFLIIICMFMIFTFSSDNSIESTKKSDSIIIKISERVLGRNLSKKEQEIYIDKFVVPVRKGAHFTIYLILGFLIISFIREYLPLTYKTIFLAIILSFLYATSDELHQLFVPGRSCEIKDILIDTLGATTGCLIFYTFHQLRRKIHE